MTECEHTWRYVKRTLSDGRCQFGKQCTDCGTWQCLKKAVVLAEVGDESALVEYEEAIRDAHFERRVAEGRTRWEQEQQDRWLERQQQRRDWLTEHDAYLRTPQWRELRSRVLERAQHVCEGCGMHRATQVHHKTYDNWRAEFLFELVAVCTECHNRIHAKGQRQVA
jgi:hypothetical protein